MKRTLSLLVVAAACFVLAAPVFAQDSDQQSLGDMVRKDKSKAKPKAKATLDEDNTQPTTPPSASSSSGQSGSAAPADSTAANADTAAKPADAAAAGADQAKPSNEDRIKALDAESKDIDNSISVLQDKIDHDSSNEQTKEIWRQAVAHARDRQGAIDKEKQQLQAGGGQQSSGQPAPPQQVSPQQ